jgi:(S)-2-hydroxyglutarate dehydrogenase
MLESERVWDVAIIGGGIVGLATAEALVSAEPGLRLVVLEKESQVASHQSGRNSGVIHSGIYYRPGSLKAALCRSGRARLLEFCRAERISHEICGKVIVATNEAQIPALLELARRGEANSVVCEVLDQSGLRRLEPHVRGIQALYVPSAGIVDFAAIARRLAERLQARPRCALRLGARVHEIYGRRGAITLDTGSENLHAHFVINCAGLQADRVARLCGQKPRATIIPFRGDYFILKDGAEALVNNLIYPVPDPRFPFLGVHATRTISGRVECGPNASLALGREAYGKFELEPGDLTDALSFPGTWNLLKRYPKTSYVELKQSLSKRAFLAALHELLPEVRTDQLSPRAAGIRAQALAPDGTLIDDFVLEESERILSVCNAPSPAATSSFAIAGEIAERVLTRL